MICAQCGERDAIVFIRRSSDEGGARDLVLCEECARSRGIVASKGSLDLDFDELIGNSLEALPGKAGAARCPACGKELSAMLRDGRLGCSSCADFFRAELKRSFGGPVAAIEDEEQAFVAATGVEGSAELKERLEKALHDEDYEEAAAIRDAMANKAGEPCPSGSAFHVLAGDFPFGVFSFSNSPGPEGDVVLWSSARLFRNFEGIPFPGSPAGTRASGKPIPVDRVFPSPLWTSRVMAELGQALRRSLAERGVVPRNYAADDGAIILSKPGDGVYAILDEIDHLRLQSIRPGFAPRAALAAALVAAAGIGRETAFARRPEVGWLCSRLSDCGTGASLSALVHIPAIVATGLRDRLFKALIAEGVVLRGFYSTGENSSGSLYEITVECAAHPSLEALAAALSAAVLKAVQSERRARAELAEKDRPALVDAEGRAFGVARHCLLLGAEEAARIVSTLRLATIRGSLTGADPNGLAGLLVSLGAASIACAAGCDSIPESGDADRIRARTVKAALANADYTGTVEEGA